MRPKNKEYFETQLSNKHHLTLTWFTSPFIRIGKFAMPGANYINQCKDNLTISQKEVTSSTCPDSFKILPITRYSMIQSSNWPDPLNTKARKLRYHSKF